MGHTEQYRGTAHVTIQNTEGGYEERSIVGYANNFPLQKQLHLARYRIAGPPRTMRNIPNFYTAKKLMTRQVLKFDIRDP